MRLSEGLVTQLDRLFALMRSDLFYEILPIWYCENVVLIIDIVDGETSLLTSIIVKCKNSINLVGL